MKILRTPASVVAMYLAALVLHTCQEEMQPEDIRQWRSTLAATSDIPEYNQSLWPAVYEERNLTHLPCQASLDPEAADE